MQAHVFGLLAEYDTPDAVLAAARKAWRAGYRQMDAYTPYPVEGLAQELGHTRTRIPSVVLAAGLVGAFVGFGMQYWTMAVDYPYNAGGRPYNSWPAFMTVTFEMMVLVSSLAAVFSLFFLNGLPQLHHPVMNLDCFSRASQDRFFLCIEAADAQFDLQKTSELLMSTEPLTGVLEVPMEKTSEEQPLPTAEF